MIWNCIFVFLRIYSSFSTLKMYRKAAINIHLFYSFIYLFACRWSTTPSRCSATSPRYSAPCWRTCCSGSSRPLSTSPSSTCSAICSRLSPPFPPWVFRLCEWFLLQLSHQRGLNESSYRGASFLAVVWFGSPTSPVRKLDRRHTGRLRKRDNLLSGNGRGGRRGDVEPNHTTARSLEVLVLYNHSILSESHTKRKFLVHRSQIRHLCRPGCCLPADFSAFTYSLSQAHYPVANFSRINTDAATYRCWALRKRGKLWDHWAWLQLLRLYITEMSQTCDIHIVWLHCYRWGGWPGRKTHVLFYWVKYKSTLWQLGKDGCQSDRVKKKQTE